MTLKRIEGGKTPPKDVELEAVVLGALLIDTNAIYTVLPVIKTDAVFYTQQHKVIFTAIQHLAQESRPIDMLTVADRLRKNKHIEVAGGEYYIAILANKVSSTAHLEEHTYLLKQHFVKRQLIENAGAILTDGYDSSVDALDALEGAQIKVDAIAQELNGVKAKTWVDVLKETTEHINELGNNKGQLIGVPTGFGWLDRQTGGWQGDKLIVLGGRPGMGKTAMVIKHTHVALQHNRPVAFFSLEMSEKDIAKRLVVAESKDLHANQLFVHGLTKAEYWEQYNQVLARVESYPLHINCKPGLSIFDMCIEARRLKHQHGIELIILDYIQLMSIGKTARNVNNREQEISTITRQLKALALELNTPIIALSQLGRDVEKRGGNKRPQLSDLRESGSIEQDADMVNFLFRPSYYDIEEWEDGQPCTGEAEYMVEKYRNGSPGVGRVGFNENRIQFFDIDEAQY